MEKAIFLLGVMASLLISCNQKQTSIDNHSYMMENDSLPKENKMESIGNNQKMYACPMHPEVQGKLNDKCSKCGMKLTEPVPVKEEESK